MKRKIKFVLIGFSSLCAAALLGGCSQMLLFDPKGPIGEARALLHHLSFRTHADRRCSRFCYGKKISYSTGKSDRDRFQF